MINAKDARKMVEDHKMLLLYPNIKDVLPFIEKTAKMGGTRVFYGVSEDIQPGYLQNLIDSLEKEGYSVESKPTNGLIALDISWE